MKTFIAPPDFKAVERLRSDVIHARLEEALKDNVEISYALPQIFQVLKKWFPLDYLTFTLATGNPSEERYYIYPEPPRVKKRLVCMKTTMEQLQVIMHGEPCVIKVGNQSDHSIVIGLLNQIFQGMSFSILIFRTLTKNKTICSLSFLCKNKEAYTDLHVTRAFSLRDILTRYFEQKCDNEGCDATAFVLTTGNMQHLSLTALPGMREVNKLIWQVARQDCPVLLLGETGTGKEIVANAIYRASARVHGPFVKMNCGSIPDTLIDTELFGHERGAFTGAFNTVKGRFERANRGVLLLDEIGELPPLAQTRLLRVLDEGIIERVGGDKEISVDVRIIAATNRNLAEMVESGKFREDLFYRLNVFPIQIPPLRERPEDIPLFIDFFIKQKSIRHGIVDPPPLEADELQALCAYPWPGNIRELQNAIESAVIRWVGNPQGKIHIEFGHNRTQSSVQNHLNASTTTGGDHKDDMCSLDECIKQHIRKALILSNGKISGHGGAAELLRIHPNTLRAKMKKLGMLHRCGK